jgi:hypothetical protein
LLGANFSLGAQIRLKNWPLDPTLRLQRAVLKLCAYSKGARH